MKIATKISAGFAALIILTVAVLFYQVALIRQVQSINENLGGLNFRAAQLSLQMLRDLDQVEEFTKKMFATGGDPGYAAQLKDMRGAVSQDLAEMQVLALSAPERKEADELTALWRKLTDAAESQEIALASHNEKEWDAALAGQVDLLSSLRLQTQSLIQATRLAIAAQVEQSSRAGQRAERISNLTALAVLMLSILVSVWIVGSISKPLRKLTEGTRAVAEGDFSYHLNVVGDDELSQLAADFNSMTRRLTEVDEMKKDFVSHVSHELKTPLASMQETIRLMLDHIPGPLNEQQRRLLDLNLQSARRLSTLIGNLLDLSRMEAGVIEYSMRRQDLAELIRTAAEELEPPIREKGLQLEVNLPEQPLWVACDSDRIIQVLNNLLGNAMKFSPRGSTIRVEAQHAESLPPSLPASWRSRLFPARQAGGFAILTVEDAGPGVPEAEREGIFQKFYQARNAKKAHGQGAGLGLSISRTIVEAHGGAIWAEEGSGKSGTGSVFRVLLNAGAPAGKPASRAASAPI